MNDRRTCVLVAIALQVLLALGTAAVKLRPGLDDVDLYRRYATRAWEGEVPYRDYRVEYPPLALPVFLAPLVVARGAVGYRLAFAAEMLLFNAGMVALVGAWVERRLGLRAVPVRLGWYTLYFVLLSRLIVARYDAASALLGFGASVWWFSGRARLGGIAAALGVLAKLVPGMVAVLAATRELAGPKAGRFRGTVAFALTLGVGLAAWLAVGGVRGVSRSLDYHLDRGLEYGSLYSGAQMLAAKLVGADIAIERGHISFVSVTPWSAPLKALAIPLQLAALAMVWAAFVARGMREGVRYSGAAVLAFILTGKVFSPQYLIWLMPFVAVLEGPIAFRGRLFFALGCAATLLAPAGLGVLPRTSLAIILAYNLKNLLFLGLLVLLVFGPGAPRAEDDGEDGGWPEGPAAGPHSQT